MPIKKSATCYGPAFVECTNPLTFDVKCINSWAYLLAMTVTHQFVGRDRLKTLLPLRLTFYKFTQVETSLDFLVTINRFHLKMVSS